MNAPRDRRGAVVRIHRARRSKWKRVRARRVDVSFHARAYVCYARGSFPSSRILGREPGVASPELGDGVASALDGGEEFALHVAHALGGARGESRDAQRDDGGRFLPHHGASDAHDEPPPHMALERSTSFVSSAPSSSSASLQYLQCLVWRL